jgi:hypothetical protein
MIADRGVRTHYGFTVLRRPDMYVLKDLRISMDELHLHGRFCLPEISLVKPHSLNRDTI